ncbi:ferredoxin [Nonomuraea sp. NPDC048916]|uniref:ferredoxin n=1 Tax=Nonomuraea sp. NPDC048916 TaxID=3154232 RepID=UPI0033E7F7BD
MRIVVDLTRCQGYAQCVFLAPEVFQLHGEEALLYAPAVPDDQLERVPGRGGLSGPGHPPR